MTEAVRTEAVRAATQQLADTLEAENAMLRALDLPAAGALLADKQDAAAALNKALAAAAGAGGPADPALRTAAIRLRDLAEENRHLLERGIAVQSRVLGVLAQAARASSPQGRNGARYGRQGAYAAGPSAGWALSARA